jgi:hypothetical protein
MLTLVLAGQHIAESARAISSSTPQDQFWLGIVRLVASGLLATTIAVTGLTVIHRMRD